MFYPYNRADWRQWLEAHHDKKTEIWLRMFRKETGKPSLSYDDLVEECLCFGWIDGVVKKLDAESRVQRIRPRRKKSFLSGLNRQRVWKLQKRGLMTSMGLVPAIVDQLGNPDEPLIIPDWVAVQLQQSTEVWGNFQQFPYFYRRLKIGWIAEAGKRRDETQKRLHYLIKMTAKGKQYGTQLLKDIAL